MDYKAKFSNVSVNYVSARNDEIEFEVRDWRSFINDLIDYGSVDKEKFIEYFVKGE